MKKNIKFLLPVLMTVLLLSLSSLSCSYKGKGSSTTGVESVEGKTFQHPNRTLKISFTTKSNCVYFVTDYAGSVANGGTYTVARKKITCIIVETLSGMTNVLKFDIINANELKDQSGVTWTKL